MSLKLTKEQLIQLLADKDNKVIALSGKWGTGKSFMWKKIQTSSNDEKIKSALYASLFGLSSIEQVKMKLIQSAVPAIEANPRLWKSAKQTASAGVKILEGFHKSFGALNDLGLIFAPAMLRQKLIVLDDIERKHEKLSIDEVLGFIDEFTQQHGSSFVLILNSDQLDKREVWNTLREKVVDQELRLDTSAAEAFEIAIGLTPSIYASRIRTTVITCSLTNIRIIRKVIKAVNRILIDRQELTEAVLSRVIPSTVLLSAIHYKGIEDGPDFDFVLAQGTARDWSLVTTKKDETEDSKRKSKWKLFLMELGIVGSDDYELLVVEFLQSGLFDLSKVAEIIDRYIAEADIMDARNDCQRFFEHAFWDYTLSDAQLLTEANKFVGKAHLIDPYTVTSLHETISELPGGQVIADSVLDRWIDAFKAKNLGEINTDDLFRRKLHPRIEAEFSFINAKVQANTTAYDACLHVAEKSGWGPRQEIAMKSASVQDMEAIIRTKPVYGMRVFMVKMLDLYIHKQTYEKHFGSAMDNFVQACRNIAQDTSSGRLGRLVKILFADSKLTNLLDP